MAINLSLFKIKEISLFKERKKQKYLLFSLAAIALLALLFGVYSIFIKEQPVPVKVEVKAFPEVKINFEFLKNQNLQNLSPFQKIPEFQGVIGRDNPFKPY